MQGLLTTIRISIYAEFACAWFSAPCSAWRGWRRIWPFRMLARTYLELLRNIPPIVVDLHLLFLPVGADSLPLSTSKAGRGPLPTQRDVGVWEFFFGDMRRFDSLISGVLVLALFESAFVGEIVRSGIQSVGRGQREAARSLGMACIDEMRFIVLPQALRKVVPPLANQFISLVKDSSIISLISVQELTYKTRGTGRLDTDDLRGMDHHGVRSIS